MSSNVDGAVLLTGDVSSLGALLLAAVLMVIGAARAFGRKGPGFTHLRREVRINQPSLEDGVA